MPDQTSPPPARGGAPLPPIRFAELAAALLAMSKDLMQQWLDGGVQRGHEYVCGSLNGGKGDSCSVNTNTGRWADFAAGASGGDLLSLYAAIHTLPMGKAALEVARAYGLEDVAGVQRSADGAAAPPRPPRPPPPAPVGPPPKEPEKWTPVLPVPPHAPPPTFWHQERKNPVHKAPYRVGDDLYGHVVRFIGSDGRKITMPYVYASSSRDGSQKWVWRGWEDPRPLFYPGGRAPWPGCTVVAVEGEIKGEVLQQLLDAHAPDVYCVVSWPNGSKSWRKADWSWLTGCTVLLWPDCDSKRVEPDKAAQTAVMDAAVAELDALGGQITDDDRARTREAALQLLKKSMPYMPADKQPGKAAMLGIGAQLRDEHQCTVSLLPCADPGVLPDGWDARDAIEVDGWDGDRVIAFFGSAYALPSAAAPAPAPAPAAAGGGGGGKKNEGPAEAGDDDPPGGGAQRDAPWWLLPYWNDKKQFWMVSRKLVISALRHDEALAGVVGLNELTNNIDARRAWPWKHGDAGPIKGSTSLQLGLYLSDTYGLPSIAVAALEEAITSVAQSNRFHPVREFLRGLEWDRTSRIDKWLIHVLGESPATLPKQLTEYLSLVGRFMLLGLVKRVMEPGCKFDYCAVLEGAGGLGKSTFVKTLATKPFFSDAHFDLTRGKEGQEQVQGVWLYELQELSSLGKAELNLIKAFISSEDDRYRPSYGRTVEKFPRQCVMIGTTNEDRYLRDRTGNRRWWPVPVRHRINNPWLDKTRVQLLAEAVALYDQGVPYTPTPEQEERLFVPMQESRLEETAVQSELMHVLTRPPIASGIGSIVNQLTDFVTNAQLCQALGVDAAKATGSLVREVGSWMKHQGWETAKRTINGARANGYVRPPRWPEVDEATLLADDWTSGLIAPPPPPPPPAGAASVQDDDDAPF